MMAPGPTGLASSASSRSGWSPMRHVASPRPPAYGSALLALISARPERLEVDDDLRMAAQCADFCAEIVEAGTQAHRTQASAAREDPHVDDAEEGLTGS